MRKDFLRKWYHTRSKKVKTVSLEECMEDEDSGIHAVADPAAEDFTEQVAGEDFCQRFKATLSPKDMAILELRVVSAPFQNVIFRRNGMSLFAGWHTCVMQPYTPANLPA